MNDTAKTLSAAERDALDRRLDMIDDARKPIREGMAPLEEQLRPFKRTLAQIDELEAIMLEEADVEILDHCEGCSRRLYTGDKGHRCEDGPTLCEDCSPTWDDFVNQRQEIAAAEGADDEDHEAFKGALALRKSHLEAGGKGTDNLAFPL